MPRVRRSGEYFRRVASPNRQTDRQKNAQPSAEQKIQQQFAAAAVVKQKE